MKEEAKSNNVCSGDTRMKRWRVELEEENKKEEDKKEEEFNEKESNKEEQKDEEKKDKQSVQRR